MATHLSHGPFDPVHALEQRGVRVRLDNAAGEARLVVVVEHRSREDREKEAHARWVDSVLASYGKLIRLQLRLAGGLLPYRTVQWLLAHGYLAVKDGRYRVVKGISSR